MATGEVTTGVADGRDPPPWHTFAVCIGGYALNAMDLLIVSPTMRKFQEGIPGANADVVLGGTAILLTAAVGGWFAGALSDRIGRVRTLQFTVAWLAVFTGLCSLTQDDTVLFMLRVLLSLGYGGIWTAAAVMVGEAFTSAHRGKFVGFMQSGWAIGWFIAIAGMQALQHLHWPPTVVRQVLFWANAFPALLILSVSLLAKDSRHFERTWRHLKDARRTADFLEIFSPAILWTTFRACVLSIGIQGGYYAIMLWLPALLAERKLTPGSYLYILIAGSFAGYLVCGATIWMRTRRHSGVQSGGR